MLPPRYYGPYQVEERIGSVSYKLRLLPKACVHNVFHVVFLKKFKGVPPTAMVPLPSIVRGRVVAEPEKVLCA